MFVINNFVRHIPIYISIISLLISAITIFKNRKRLIVRFPNEYAVLPDNSISFINNDEEMYTYPYGALFQINVINPCQFGIGYFYLHLINQNGDTVSFLTQDSCGRKAKDAWFSVIHHGDPSHIDIPVDDSGIFKSNSYQIINLFANELPMDTQEITVTFNVTIESFLGLIKRTKTYKRTYDLSSYQISLQELQQSEQQMIESANLSLTYK